MSIKLLTFDLDDTLWDVATVITHAEDTLRRWLGENAPLLGPLPLAELHHYRDQLLANEPALKHRISELRQRLLHHALSQAGYSQAQAQALAEHAFAVFLSARQEVELFADVHSTLAELSKRYSLAVITNGNADVRRIGLGHYFEFTLSAEELGVGKPDPLPFTTALHRAGVQAAQAVHIGDHPRDDIAGAQHAGYQAIWVNRSSEPWSGQSSPDGQISALAQLPDVLATLG